MTMTLVQWGWGSLAYTHIWLGFLTKKETKNAGKSHAKKMLAKE